jgi:hypothetical protein
VSKEFMDDVESRKIFPSTVAYMCYRYDRFWKIPQKQQEQMDKLSQYVSILIK